MRPGRVLVTGASGLIGRHVGPALEALGYDAVPLSRKGGALSGDLLTDPEGIVARAGADHLIHLAWHDGAARWTSAANLDWIGASLALLRAFAASGGKRVVMVGSCAEYDWSTGGAMAETTPLRPATLYGAAKAATGIAAMAAAPVLGLSLAWARPFFCYGPGEPEGRLFGDLAAGLRAGRTVDCTDGSQRRDFLHAADVANALAAIMGSAVVGAVNVGSGQSVPVRHVIGEFASALGRPDLVRYGARPRPAGDPDEIAADISRLRDEVGFRPHYDLATGIRAVLAEGAQ